MLRWLCGLAALLSFISINQADPVPPTGQVSYTRDVRPFLDRYCVSCHRSQKAKAGVNVETFDSLFGKSGEKAQNLIDLKSPANSRLVRTLHKEGRKRMPPPNYNKQPARDELDLIQRWIELGAINDTPDK